MSRDAAELAYGIQMLNECAAEEFRKGDPDVARQMLWRVDVLRWARGDDRTTFGDWIKESRTIDTRARALRQ